MSFLYVTENGATLGIDGGVIYIDYPDKHRDEIPKNTVTGISLFGQIQMTSAMTKFCFENGIRVGYFSSNGNYYGTLIPVEKSDITRMKNQFKLTDDKEFCICISRKFINAKISNQLVILRRYFDYTGIDNKEEFLNPLKIFKEKVKEAKEIDGI